MPSSARRRRSTRSTARSSVEIKPGAQSADIVTVKDRGVTRLRGGGRGDLKVGIQVVTPVRLNSKETQIIKQFASQRPPDPPAVRDLPAGPVRQAPRPLPQLLDPPSARAPRDSARTGARSGTVNDGMASLYLNPQLEPADAEVGARVSVTGDEARHASTVARVRDRRADRHRRRLRVPGLGTRRRGGRDELAIEVDEVRHEPEPEPPLLLAQALAKGDRDELAVQAATELGVSGVIPWAAERSVSRWEGAKRDRGRERWRSIVREASKQAIRPRVPGCRRPDHDRRAADDARPPHRARTGRADRAHRAHLRRSADHARGRARRAGSRRASSKGSRMPAPTSCASAGGAADLHGGPGRARCDRRGARALVVSDPAISGPPPADRRGPGSRARARGGRVARRGLAQPGRTG